MSRNNESAARLERLVDALEALILESDAAEMAELASSSGTSIGQQAARIARHMARRRTLAPPSPSSGSHCAVIGGDATYSVLTATPAAEHSD